MAKIEIKNYSKADLAAYREICGTAAREESWEGLGDHRFVELRLHKPHYEPENALFLARVEGEGVVGFADLTPELKINRVVVDGFVHPRCRRRGVAGRLLARAWERCREMGAKVIHICLDEESKGAQAFLLSQGFTEVRSYLLMERTLLSGWDQVLGDELDQLHYFGEGEEGLLADLQNRIFAGSWGFCPNTRADVSYYLAVTGIEIQDVIVAKDGKKIVGYVWQQVVDDRRHATESKRGWIHMFGVLDQFRGNNWGRKLILSGLHQLCRQGAGRVELTVDRQNRPAVNLYTSLDFTVKSHKLWFEKKT
ncbi:MAG: GNAT family N-acetyltransferase [Candidatus Aminicenantes bacterium]|nr:GNAT family N-acetyltransferase [Candidatus Aminicenantes bacterium]